MGIDWGQAAMAGLLAGGLALVIVIILIVLRTFVVVAGRRITKKAGPSFFDELIMTLRRYRR